VCWDRSVGSAPRVVVRVLRPVLEVERAGRLSMVRPAVAKLLLALVIAHPRPLHVEQVAEHFWPGVPLSQVRGRLDSLAHRLRSTLGEAGNCVVRTEGRLALDPARAPIEVDLFDLRAAMARPDGARVRDLAAVTGNLCEVQFPYDEFLVDARHHFVASWLFAARRAGIGISADFFGPALRALGLTAGELEANSPATR
jgi:DNA-binding SARP family transcriptional activator